MLLFFLFVGLGQKKKVLVAGDHQDCKNVIEDSEKTTTLT